MIQREETKERERELPTEHAKSNKKATARLPDCLPGAAAAADVLVVAAVFFLFCKNKFNFAVINFPL